MKIEAKELMIDNYISYLAEKKQVLGFDEETVYFKNTISIDYIDIDEIEPIPLTEEWLLKFGFKKRKNRHLFHWENKIVISEYKDEFENFFYPKTGYDIRFSNEIKYVHQLQNLYFALTGAELTVA